MAARVPVRATGRTRRPGDRPAPSHRASPAQGHLRPVEHHVVELQQTAGNSAVVTMLQRDDVPEQPPATPAQRLKDATTAATTDWITGHVPTVYAAAPDGGTPAWTEALRKTLG